eukprot:TRINITY_DN1056_c0_g1_i1.p1 TRINITY_DN1056_c0_g1~~TRINITY_DN1056_c0_g1_i1.p1  ORF type:complete len:229 (+),score=41.30 TRINITY_DN1056_c0_g1_i1:85-771(+)
MRAVSRGLRIQLCSVGSRGFATTALVQKTTESRKTEPKKINRPKKKVKTNKRELAAQYRQQIPYVPRLYETVYQSAKRQWDKDFAAVRAQYRAEYLDAKLKDNERRYRQRELQMAIDQINEKKRAEERKQISVKVAELKEKLDLHRAERLSYAQEYHNKQLTKERAKLMQVKRALINEQKDWILSPEQIDESLFDIEKPAPQLVVAPPRKKPTAVGDVAHAPSTPSAP